ncbi:hypothetical protein DY000_02059675 [Brassica cretica]|uniref:Pentatricopeptide repeat-containing protein n=1 Tax=Brassica cretica TaxID=69181 RepID=A0ABQ7ANY6_BRACR|nr:hypothetical protein DY000_02059675 [Brassica cretica]
MRIVVAPFSSSAESQITTSSSSSCSAENAKSCIFGKLQFLITETLDFITREEEKKGVSVPTKEDLVFWAKQLDKDGKNHYALEIFEWMDKKKMEFSPSELAFFVDLIAKGMCIAGTHLRTILAPEVYGVVADILSLSFAFECISFSWIQRVNTKEADALAKQVLAKQALLNEPFVLTSLDIGV